MPEQVAKDQDEMKPARYPHAPKQADKRGGYPAQQERSMILGKELLEHGKVTQDGSGRIIDPGAPYVRTINDNWFRSGTQPGSRLHELQRPWGVSAERDGGDADNDRSGQAEGQADPMQGVPPTN